MGKLFVSSARVRTALKREADAARRCARGLQSEIERGICIRQSAESKASRVQVLQSEADTLEALIKELCE
jgi:hypothetical protein